MRLPALILSVVLASAAAFAEDFSAGSLRIEQPWARATAGNLKTAAAYLLIRNDGSEPDRLLRVETPVAERAMLHRSEVTNGVARMFHMQSVEVAPGATAALSPENGNHVMLEGLKQPLKRGETVPLTLVFEKAGQVTVKVTIEAAGARAATKAHGHH
jgi:periplasmic copper chaperone A